MNLLQEATVKLILMDVRKIPVLNLRELHVSTTHQRKSPTTVMNTVVPNVQADFLSLKAWDPAKVN